MVATENEARMVSKQAVCILLNCCLVLKSLARLPGVMLRDRKSAIHKAAGSLVTSRSYKTAGWNAPQRWFLLVASIDSQWILLCSTGIVPVEIMERPGTVRPAAL